MSGYKKTILIILIFISMSAALSGCTKLALRLSPSLFSGFSSSFFEECDIELAKSSIPANLKILEGLLKNDSKNKDILRILTTGFCGYSMLFVEGVNPERASALYLRARNYGLDAINLNNHDLLETDIEKLKSKLASLEKSDLEILLWTTTAWMSWINLNLDKPLALAQLKTSQIFIEHLLETLPDYQYGFPHILMGTNLSARPQMFGGNPEKAEFYFKEALKSGDRKYFLAQYYFARYYSVRIQDRKLFERLLEEIINGDPGELIDVCLINSVLQEKAKELRGKADDLFI